MLLSNMSVMAFEFPSFKRHCSHSDLESALRGADVASTRRFLPRAGHIKPLASLH
jgi:hypothetical protein